MKVEDLKKLRNEILIEQKRRKKNNELLENDIIQEFLKINNLDIIHENLDIEDIIQKILKTFKINETSEIYVLTRVYETRLEDYYDKNYYDVAVEFDSKYATYKEYKNIENYKMVNGYLNEKTMGDLKIYAPDFENKYIVLNPYNSKENDNGFNEVRRKFFIDSVEYGEEKAKTLLLEKYTRL